MGLMSEGRGQNWKITGRKIMIKKFDVCYELKYDPKSKKKEENNIANFYSHHRMKIYNASVYADWEGTEGRRTYKFNIDDKLVEKYESDEEIYRYLKRLKDNKNIYSIQIQPNDSYRFRNDEMGQYYAEKFKEYKKNGLSNLSASCAKNDTEKEYLSPEGKSKHGNIIPIYTYYITIFSKGLSGLLQQLFISTLAYENANLAWPDGVERESFKFSFDPITNTATLVDLNIYNPENPYNKYIRKSMRIVRKQTVKETDEKDAIDYYLEDKITPWYKYDEKVFKDGMKSDENAEGIYMLYDSKNNYFYVGKAEKVFKRMQEHRDSEEWIKDFDYYRYSLIDPYYLDDIFLVENAAIHDCAMILNMFSNKDYNEKSLSAILPVNVTIQDIYMVNSVKKQTKRPGKTK